MSAAIQGDRLEDLCNAHSEMSRIRHLEEKILELRLSGDIVGSVHLCIGQEAIAVGVGAARRADDPVFATYRGHGWAMACGTPPERLLRELLGRTGGVNEGRGGSAYFNDPSVGFMGENSIVGAGAPIAVGAALASFVDDRGEVAIVAFGVGAMNLGSVHEALIMAAALRLPVLFVCENNLYSELTPIADMVAVSELHVRAAAYGMPGRRVDGNDPLAVRIAASEALERARNGGGPSLIEAMTERLCGHYIGDAEQYRPPGEVDLARSREPLTVARARLIRSGVAEADVDAIERAASEEIERAAQAALAAPLADVSTVREHVHG